MADEKQDFEHESLQDTESIAKYLDTLVHGFQSGRLLFCAGTKELVLKPDGLITLRIKARRKDGTVKIGLKMGWKERERSAADAEPLHIDVPNSEDV